MNAASRTAPRTDVVLLGALYAAEFCALAVAVCIHRLGDRSLASSILSTPGIAAVAALGGLLVAIALIVHRYLSKRRSGDRGFGLTVAMNLVTVALIFACVEISVRLLSRSTPDTAVLANTVLAPRSWENATDYYRQILAKAEGDLLYLVYDEALGWTVGPSRRAAKGLYLSSAEGLRAARQGVVLAGPTKKRRVAIVGDSFVFAELVTFEESWGHLLEANSGGEVQVLNFGVGGYGIDQSYLRLKKDIIAWKPDVVIMGFPLADIFRTITVYPFINWPEWSMPFSKPRIVPDGNALKVLNVPAIAPTAIFAKSSITDLPYLEYDAGFSAREWRQSLADISYAKRALFSAVTPWSEPAPYATEDNLIQLNAAIFRAFIELANENQIIPLLAYFPGQPEIERLSRGEPTPAQRILDGIGVPLVDTTPCIMEVGAIESYIPGDPHYSARGNAAVAKCVGAALDRVLGQRQAQGR